MFDSRTYIGQMTDISTEPSSNVYTNLLSCNPLDMTTLSNNNTANYALAATTMTDLHRERSPSPLRLSTTSLPSAASHSSGTLPKLIRQESQSIPIPNRAQSFDNIHYHQLSNSYCSSPQSDYCLSPTSQYTRSVSPSFASPPIRDTNQQMYGSKFISVGGSIMVAKRAITRATSPLSSSVPTTTGFTRTQSLNVHRSEKTLIKKKKITIKTCVIILKIDN